MFSKRRLPAYLSVEASVLVPLALFLTVFIIHASFYLYGRCVLTQDNYLIAMRAANVREGSDRTAYAGETAAAQTKNHYFGNEPPVMKASVSKDAVAVTMESAANRTGYDLANAKRWESAAFAKAEITNAPAHIRRIDRGYDLLQKALKGGEE